MRPSRPKANTVNEADVVKETNMANKADEFNEIDGADKASVSAKAI